MCGLLAEIKAVPHPAICLMGGALIGSLKRLQAGEYEIAPQASLAQILNQLSKGDVIIYKVTIPEGLTSYEIVERLNGLPKLEGLIEEIPEDGTLFPSTYAYKKGDARASLIAQMKNELVRISSAIWDSRPENSPLASREEMLTLASLIEKETSLPSERPIVSAVFHNRLKIGMRLQCDPTVVYALSNGKGKIERDLSRIDLQIDHPFNTYTTSGLPPHAIANPGLLAMKAAIQPANMPYLYFVADGTGGHQFSSSLDLHQKNHQAWRTIRDQKK